MVAAAAAAAVARGPFAERSICCPDVVQDLQSHGSALLQLSELQDERSLLFMVTDEHEEWTRQSGVTAFPYMDVCTQNKFP